MVEKAPTINLNPLKTTMRSDSEIDSDDDVEITDYSDSDNSDDGFQKLQSSIQKFSASASKKAASSSSQSSSRTAQNLSESMFAGELSKAGDVSMESLLGVLGQTTGASAVSKQLLDMKKTTKAPVAVEKVVANRLERKEVYDASKDDMKKWQDIVVENRHVRTLDLAQDKHQQPSYKTLISKYTPVNDFEKEIQMVLVKTGTSESEAAANEVDELSARHMSLEEIKEKQADIAKAKALMFYEQMKRHRINKIKSKTFRRIKKKQKEKKERNGIEDLADDDEEAANAIIEEQTLKRIKERMNLRHKNTGKWAKMALSAHGKRDSSVREAYQEQVLLGQELLKKVNNNNDDDDDDDDSDSGSDDYNSNSDYDSDEYGDRGQKKHVNRMRKELKNVLENSDDKQPEVTGKFANLFKMDFMKNAAETKNLRLKEQAKAMLREIDEMECPAASSGDESHPEGENDSDDGNERASSVVNNKSNVLDIVEDAGLKLSSGSRRQKLSFASGGSIDDSHMDIAKNEPNSSNNNSNLGNSNSKNISTSNNNKKNDNSSADVSNPWLSNSSEKDKSKAKTTTNSNGSASSDITSNAANSKPKYIAATKFSGVKPGYLFTTGKSGLGYYLDVKGASTTNEAGVAVVQPKISPKISQKRVDFVNGLSTGTEGSKKSAAGSDIPSFKQGAFANASDKTADLSAESNSSKDKSSDQVKEKKSLIATKTQQELVHQAFAGPDLEKEFLELKEKSVRDELGFDDKRKKVVQDVKAGWGDWAGPGEMMVSDKIKRIRDFKIKKIELEENEKLKTRLDKRMPNVMLSERKVKSASKFMVAEVPHPFETREQYERSLQMPLGEEWNASHVHRKNTKPDILIRSGRLIEPISLPKGNRKRDRDESSKQAKPAASKMPRKIR